MQKPESSWIITHKNKDKDTLWSGIVHNALTAEGERLYLASLYQNAPLAGFYVRLFNDTPTREDIIGNLSGEPSTNGYLAQLIERNDVGWPVLERTIPQSETGVAQSGSSNTITLAATANAADDFYTYATIEITGGAGVDQRRDIVTYNGTTKVATVDSNWSVATDSSSAYTVHSDYYILSKVVTFAAVGGSWGPVTHAIMATEPAGITGTILAYFPLNATRTLAAGDTLEFSGMIKFR